MGILQDQFQAGVSYGERFAVEVRARRSLVTSATLSLTSARYRRTNSDRSLLYAFWSDELVVGIASASWSVPIETFAKAFGNATKRTASRSTQIAAANQAFTHDYDGNLLADGSGSSLKAWFETPPPERKLKRSYVAREPPATKRL
jgi:hypothetical protein